MKGIVGDQNSTVAAIADNYECIIVLESREVAMDKPGVWIMLAFWVSAIGGIVVAVAWARARNRNPVRPQVLRRSLKERLERGDISQAAYDERLRELDQRDAK